MPALNAEQAESLDSLDTLIDETSSGFVPISEDIAAVIEKAADRATSFESFREELQRLVTEWPPDKIAGCIAVAMFKARALGDTEFEKEE
jgi:hypothetical protein